YRSHHDMPQVHPLRCLRDSVWLIDRRRCVRPAGGHIAESARPRADVAEDHEGGGAAGEAFRAIRTRERLAHRMQRVRAKKGIEFVQLSEVDTLLANPFGQTGAHKRNVSRLS